MKYERSVELLRPYLQPDMVALDVGCGDACRTALLAQYVQKVIGIENQKKPLEFAEIILRDMPVCEKIELREYDGKTPPFPEKMFDVITTFDVIEHLPISAVAPWLDTLHRLLKPGGLLLIVTPNPREIRGRIFGHTIADKHYKEYTPEELRALTATAGFHTRALHGAYVPPPIPYIEHYANVFPMTQLFKLFIQGAKNIPNLSETVFFLVQKPVE